ncbi:MAG: TonB-dependent siderophore receptor [Acetobacter okinawensis]|uniref:TonB-dependent siderophore receptor n=1 Tax=Acetobacter okinawensis TaxID=1076594 RepID=UPI0039ED74B7
METATGMPRGINRTKNSAFAMLLLVSSGLCAVCEIMPRSALAEATAGVKPYHIPAQALSTALTTFGQQAHRQVSVDPKILSGHQSAALNGNFTEQEALARLLAGSGLTGRVSGNVISVSAASNITLGPVRVGGTVTHQDPTGPGVGYVAENTMTGTKTDTPLIEIPNSIYVITKQQMVDQQPQNISEALRYAPGVKADTAGGVGSGAAFNQGGGITQRGFNTTQFVDGLRSTSQAAGETAFVDRVEVMNGPASVMYGQVTPGGMIGMSLKTPTQAPLHQVSLGFGNWGRYEATFDTSDKITKSGNVRYRIAGIGVTQGTQTDHVDYHRVGVLPSITWDIDAKTSLTFLGSYMYTPGTGTSYATQYPVQGTLITDGFKRIPRSNFIGFTNWNEDSVKDAMFEYQFKHEFNKYINFSQTFRWEKSDANIKEAENDGAVSATDVADQYYYTDRQHLVTDTKGMDARFTGKLTTGPLHHTWVVGSDFRSFDNNFSSQTDTTDTIINVYNPGTSSYTPCYNINSNSGCLNTLTREKYNYFQEGVYFQDQIKWRGLSVIAGGRQDWVNTTTSAISYDNTSNIKIADGPDHTKQPQSAFTWRAGLVYQFNFGLAPYFSYSTSFVPQSSTDYQGKPFSPLTGNQYEAGLKYKVPNKEIFVTASAFHILENHYSIKDMEHTGYSTDAGTVKSQGFEVSINANVTENLRLIASYSFTDARFAKNNRTAKRINPVTGATYGNAISEQGMSVPYIPRNMASVFANYTVPSSIVQGVSINGGIRYTGSSYAGYVESFKSPDYLLFDIGANYDLGAASPILKGLKAQLAISNLTNKYYLPSCGNSVCYVGQGRRVYGNLTYNW